MDMRLNTCRNMWENQQHASLSSNTSITCLLVVMHLSYIRGLKKKVSGHLIFTPLYLPSTNCCLNVGSTHAPEWCNRKVVTQKSAWDHKFESRQCHSRVQENKTGHAPWVGGMAYILSAVDNSDTSQSWLSGLLCSRGGQHYPVHVLHCTVMQH